jgi:hypothetical protein
MTENKFSLLNEPWIPIVDVGRVGLRQLFSDPCYRALGGNPVQKIALTKLLLAIAQAAYTPEDNDDWGALGYQGLAEKCLQYLDKWQDRFYLYGEKPFLQMPAISKAKEQSLGAVLPEIATGNTTIYNAIQIEKELSDADKAFFQQRLEQPTPRNKIGQGLVDVATSAIDISDGLLADLGHILAKSKVGARLDLSKLPLSSAMAKIARKNAEKFALQSGDDYELCFTVPPRYVEEMEQQFQGQCTSIGIITDDDGLYCLNENDDLIDLTGAGTGYDHFK